MALNEIIQGLYDNFSGWRIIRSKEGTYFQGTTRVDRATAKEIWEASGKMLCIGTECPYAEGYLGDIYWSMTVPVSRFGWIDFYLWERNGTIRN